jgi:hypothetical protein
MRRSTSPAGINITLPAVLRPQRTQCTLPHRTISQDASVNLLIIGRKSVDRCVSLTPNAHVKPGCLPSATPSVAKFKTAASARPSHLVAKLGRPYLTAVCKAVNKMPAVPAFLALQLRSVYTAGTHDVHEGTHCYCGVTRSLAGS